MTNIEMEIVFEMMGSKLGPGSLNRPATCPLASRNHRKGTDKSKSLMAKAGDPALFQCWACSEKGTVRSLTKTFGSFYGDFRPYEYVKEVEGDYSDYRSIAKRTYIYGTRSKTFASRLKKDESKYINEEVVSKFCENIPNYASERGMTPEQIIKWEVGFDPIEKRITFPVRDEQRKLFGLTGRDLTGQQNAKWKHYYGTKKESVFYGEQFLDSTRTVHIVEAPFDVFNLERMGLSNVFSVMGTQLSFDQMKKIDKWFDEIIFFPDGDLPGLKFAQSQAQRIYIQLGKKVGVAGVSLNPNYFLQDKTSGAWDDSDYRFQILEPLLERDPANWIAQDLNLALSSVGVFDVTLGGYRVEVQDWS